MEKLRESQIKNSLLLLLASVVWGLAFVAQSIAGSNIGTFTFNGIRFIIGGICLLPFLRGHNVRPSKIPPNKLLGGVICGLALFLASTFQQAGIALGATAGQAGFLTACYIVLVPILGLFIGRKCSNCPCWTLSSLRPLSWRWLFDFHCGSRSLVLRSFVLNPDLVR